MVLRYGHQILTQRVVLPCQILMGQLPALVHAQKLANLAQSDPLLP